jgi:3-oxoadipate enol-lactonase
VGTGPGAWAPQVEAFGGSRPVLAPRLRLEAGFDIEAEAARLWRSLEPEEIDLCGLSLGALVALRAALDQPSRVRRLVLCAGFAMLPRRLRALQAVLGVAAALLPERTLREQLVAALPPSARDTARRETAEVDRAAIRAVFRAGRTFDVARQLERLTMPVLVLVGERDGANRRLSRTLADQLPSAELRVVPGAGHVANLDAPAAFNEALREFLESR